MEQNGERNRFVKTVLPNLMEMIWGNGKWFVGVCILNVNQMECPKKDQIRYTLEHLVSKGKKLVLKPFSDLGFQ